MCVLLDNALIVIVTKCQGRRKPRMGPGTAKILHIFGFVQSKRSKENGTIFSGFSSDLEKKGLCGEMAQFSPDFQVISKKECLRSTISIDAPYEAQCALSRAA